MNQTVAAAMTRPATRTGMVPMRFLSWVCFESPALGVDVADADGVREGKDVKEGVIVALDDAEEELVEGVGVVEAELSTLVFVWILKDPPPPVNPALEAAL